MGKEAIIPFTYFLFKNKVNKWTIVISAALAILEFIIFKMLYPFASFMPDSVAYIDTALNNYAIHFWPVGYSRFLHAAGTIFQNDTTLVLFQYLFLQAGMLYFLFTFFYFVKASQMVRYILLAFFVLNPLFLITSNYISADALFLAISFIWIAELLWLLYRPNAFLLPVHAVTLLLAFTVRYNALYYPMISAVMIIASKLRRPGRLAGVGLFFLLIAAFSWHCSNKYKELTGERQFTAFGGWQLAANALYAYSKVNDRSESVPFKFSKLHQIVTHHADSLNKLYQRPDSTPGIYYLWKGPLLQYLTYRYNDTSFSDFKHYALLAPLYKEYGMYLITKYPKAYAQYFLWPNIIRYYAPPAEFLGQYNIYSNTVPPTIKNWFGYRSSKVTGYSKEFTMINHSMPVLSAIINLLFVGSLIGFALTGGFKRFKQLSPVLILITAFWLTNMCFSVLASPIVLRYQLFTMSLIFCAGVLLVEFIYNSDFVPNEPNNAQPQNTEAGNKQIQIA
jgi:hypothetical protein